MRTTRYVQVERLIVKADNSGVWERWAWGLRLLHDPTAMSKSGKSLQPGVTAQLIGAAKRATLTLSEREIQWRLQCARAYETDSQIRNAITDLKTWYGLTQAGFPPVPMEQGELPFDWRTEDEKRHQRDQAYAAAISGQQAFSFFQDYDPVTATLAELETYTVQQEELSRRFMDHSARRRAYLEELKAAVGGDMDATWEDAHRAARPEEDL